MKKLFILFILLLPALVFADAGLIGEVAQTPAAGDTTPPEFSSATIAADGATVTVVFNEAVSTAGYDANDLDLDCTTSGNDVGLTYSSGTGTDTIVLAAGSTLAYGETCTLDFDAAVGADDIEDLAGNDLLTFSNQAVSNNTAFPIAEAAITFWWEVESTTVEYSAGDSSATKSGTYVDIDTTGTYSGTNGMHVYGYDFYGFDGVNIFSTTEGRIGMWVNFSSCDPNDPSVFNVYFGGGTSKPHLRGKQRDSDCTDGKLTLDNQSLSDINLSANNNDLTIDTWYWAEFWYDHSDDTLGFAFYNESDLSSATAHSTSGTFEAFTDVGDFRVGSSSSGGVVWIDHVIVVNDHELDLRPAAKVYGYPYAE